MVQLLRLAKVYNKRFGFNVLPVKGKRPVLQWENWQIIEQTQKDVEDLGWAIIIDNGEPSVTGIGAICGINQLRNLDFDKVEDERIVKEFAKKLGLGDDYRWTIRSGSGKGFHLWFRVRESESLSKRLNGPKSVYRLDMKEDGVCDHIELRWKNSQTLLPYSSHESGGFYSFCYHEPNETPKEIEPEVLLECLDEYCDLEKEKKVLEVGKRTFEPTGFDTEKLDSAIDYLAEKLPANCYDEWYRIGFGLVTIGEEGKKYFLRMSLSNPNYHDTEYVISKKFDELMKKYDGRITLGTVYHIAEKYGWKKPFVRFWYLENDKTKISKQRFKRFLEENGFCKMQLEKGYLLLKVTRNIVREVEIFNIKDFVIDYLRRLDNDIFRETNKSKVIDALIKGTSQHFVHSFLEFLHTINLEFLRDTNDKGYLFFSNCFVEVTKARVNVKRYEELEGYIWHRQVISKKFEVDNKESEFGKFIRNVCNKDEQRILSLRSAIGYLLHNYKDSTNAKAVIFLDEKIGDGAYGRSGKGLVAQAIGKLRKTVRLDGRNFSFTKSFSFQSINLDTTIIEFNDVAKKFNFDKLFSIITDDLTVEKKNQNEIIIPFHKSPKIIISTNFTIPGSDDSSIDRQFVVEFSDHYNKRHRPIDEFKHRFFDEWNNEEWNSFLNYMIGCLQLYLNAGLIECEHVNLEEKKLIDSTSEEFAEFFRELNFTAEHNTKSLWNKFKKEYDDFEDLKLTKFTRWVKEAGRIKGFRIIERKSGKSRFISFSEAEPNDKDEIDNLDQLNFQF